MMTLSETLDNIDLVFNRSNISGPMGVDDRAIYKEPVKIDPNIAFKTLINKMIQNDGSIIATFGAYLYYSFFADEDDEYSNVETRYDFDFLDCVCMLCNLSDTPDIYEYLITDFQTICRDGEIEINYDFSDADDIAITNNGEHTVLPDEDVDNITERVSGIFGPRNMNRKKRLIWQKNPGSTALSVSKLKYGKSKRRIARLTTNQKQKDHRYYIQHQNKLKHRQQMYHTAMKKGKHFKKVRVRAG